MPVKPSGGATSESPEVPDTCAVRFTPPLPAWKQRAIMQLGVGLENKVGGCLCCWSCSRINSLRCLFAQVVIEFEEVFWPDVDFLGAVTNKPADCSYFLNVHRSVPAPSGASAVE